MKNKSLLQSVVGDIVEEDVKSNFINKIYNDTGISKKRLNEIYLKGYEKGKSSNINPTALAKAQVYYFIEKNSESIKETYSSEERTRNYAKHLVQKARNNNQTSKDLAKIAQTQDKLGHPNADAYYKAADILKGMESGLYKDIDQSPSDRVKKDAQNLAKRISAYPIEDILDNARRLQRKNDPNAEAWFMAAEIIKGDYNIEEAYKTKEYSAYDIQRGDFVGEPNESFETIKAYVEKLNQKTKNEPYQVRPYVDDQGKPLR